MPKLLLLLLILLFTACGSKKFYTLGEQLNIESKTTHTEQIDVVKVIVPKYLKEHKVVRQVTPYQIELVDKAHWLIPMEKKLTQMLIDYLQQSMKNPNIQLYPWAGDNKTSKRIALDIKRFIASNKKVSLRANYTITKLGTNSSKTSYFETEVKTKENIESMMQAMEEAYLELLEEISSTIINNK